MCIKISITICINANPIDLQLLMEVTLATTLLLLVVLSVRVLETKIIERINSPINMARTKHKKMQNKSSLSNHSTNYHPQYTHTHLKQQHDLHHNNTNNNCITTLHNGSDIAYRQCL
jgi:hypothetical protein